MASSSGACSRNASQTPCSPCRSCWTATQGLVLADLISTDCSRSSNTAASSCLAACLPGGDDGGPSTKVYCELCQQPASLYCPADEARLCWDCDYRIHSANFLVARHLRAVLCHCRGFLTAASLSLPIHCSHRLHQVCRSCGSQQAAASAQLPIEGDEERGECSSVESVPSWGLSKGRKRTFLIEEVGDSEEVKGCYRSSMSLPLLE